MKKIKYFILIVFSIFFISNVNALDISNINMDVYLKNDGSAHITEKWTVFVDEDEDITEIYKGINNIGESTFTNFKVSLNGQNYNYIDNWDIDESFSYKSYKNGINYTDDGVELCWGITKKNKVNTYEISYDITDAILHATDADVFYWELVTKAASNRDAYIKIHSDFKYEDTLGVWGFGNYGGTAYVYNGYIEASSKGDNNEPLDSDEYITVLVKFPQNTFSNADYKTDEYFNHYLEMAQDGAEVYEDSNSDSSFFDFFYPLIFIIPCFIAGFNSRNNQTTGNKKIKFGKEGKKIPKDINYVRDLPTNKDIYRAYWYSKTYGINKKDSDLLGAVLLKWIDEDRIKVKKDLKTGLFKKEESSLVLKNNKEFAMSFEKDLYDMIMEASGDGILEAKEFKKWANNNYKEVFDWFKDVLDYETEVLYNEGKLTKLKYNKYQTTESLKQEAIMYAGIKKFLLEFSRIYEKNPIEVKLWKEYLIFAQIFGIAEQVAKDFKNIYPDVIPDDYMDDFTFIYFISYSGVNSASAAKSRAESYNSGGGGFSSGGGGGGSFGGGGFSGGR